MENTFFVFLTMGKKWGLIDFLMLSIDFQKISEMWKVLEKSKKIDLISAF